MWSDQLEDYGRDCEVCYVEKGLMTELNEQRHTTRLRYRTRHDV